MSDPFKQYLTSLQTALAAGNATEHTHRPALKTLLESLGERLTATNEPRQVTDCGKPDISVKKGPVLLGYIETKDIGKKLDEEEKTRQIKNYQDGFPNLILTDYLEFRWYVRGKLRLKASLGARDGNRLIKGQISDLTAVKSLLEQFLTCEIPTVGRAEELAVCMAALARIIHDATLKTLQEELKEPDKQGILKYWLAQFEQTLIKNLLPEDFADMYAQTMSYGLFAAKVTVGTSQELTKDTAYRLIPETNPFLKNLFYHLAGPEVPETVKWVIDDLVSLLNKTEWDEVLKDFGKGSLEKDPVVHFYETFLKHYNPEKREKRGVYYTPEPVVSYIVRAIDYLLKDRFGRPWGLADHYTLILDPACGTGTFLHSVFALIHQSILALGQEGGWNTYVNEHLLPRIFGFELLMTPYTVAHLKLDLLLRNTGYRFAGRTPGEKPPRLGIYLTNTLEEGFKPSPEMVVAGYIAAESNAATQVKQDRIEVILGNPPYSGHSANASRKWEFKKKTARGKEIGTWELTFIGRLIEDYKQVDGKPLGEKNPKVLQDDYVKFLRWGQWRITQTGLGVLAMITNHGYLDGPTFRGMRQQIMQSFSEIYLLNLHGNARKKEVCPDGSKDENVFDIQQGVAIGIFVKKPGDSAEARIYHADLWGLREGKYQALAEMEMGSTPWQELQPTSPFYLFVPQAVHLRAEYEQGWRVNEIFPLNVVGLFTSRDHLAIGWSAEEVWKTVRDFAALPEEQAREKYKLGQDVRDWKVKLAQADIKNSGPNQKLVVPILYRPFDVRFTYYTGKSRGFICMPRPEVNSHILSGKNIVLMTSRLTKGEEFAHSQVTRNIAEKICMSPKTSNNGFAFPLYLYPDNKLKGGKKLFDVLEKSQVERLPNINKKFIEIASQLFGLSFIKEGRGDLEITFGPEDVFYYTYAVLHSPTYRQRYVEFLRGDFPRLPLTGNKALFAALVEKGAELVFLHLLESPALERFITRFPISGSDELEVMRYDENSQRVYINADQYFEGVPPEVWAFQVGGYQVCQKWLKDRRGRHLSSDYRNNYQKIVVALAETIRLMGKIDAAIDAHGGWPMHSI